MRRLVTSLGLLALAVPLLASHALAAGEAGNAVIRDTVVQSDTLVVSLQGVTPPPAGSHYEGWLRSADSSERTDLGAVTVAPGGAVDFTYVSPRSENLIGVNSVFEMSVEPDGDTDPNPSGTVAFRGQLADGILPAARELLFRWPESRFGTPTAEGLAEDGKLIDSTAAQLSEAANSGDLDGAKRMAERIVNTVEGQNGAKFGDLNGDGQAEGPGDGTGLLNYAWGSYWRAKIAQDGAPGDAWVALHAGHVTSSVNQLVNWAGMLRDSGVTYIAINDPAEAKQKAQDMRNAATYLLSGYDANGDGVIDVGAGEGGAQQVLEHSQLMVAFQVSPV